MRRLSQLRFRLRTLLIVVTAAAVIAAIAGSVLSVYRPVAIWRSLEGQQAIKLLSDADQISIELHIDGEKHVCELPPESRTVLLNWLKKGVRDIHPAKRVMLGDLRLQSASGDDWLVLEMNRDEVSVQTRYGTWRGLDRLELERIVRRSDTSQE